MKRFTTGLTFEDVINVNQSVSSVKPNKIDSWTDSLFSPFLLCGKKVKQIKVSKIAKNHPTSPAQNFPIFSVKEQVGKPKYVCVRNKQMGNGLKEKRQEQIPPSIPVNILSIHLKKIRTEKN